jgi:hypothetical protein
MTAHPETDRATAAGATHTASEVLTRLRTLAAELDPDRRGRYQTMERARWVAAASAAQASFDRSYFDRLWERWHAQNAKEESTA